MPPRSRKRARDESPPTPILVLTGGHASAPRIIEKYRNGQGVDAVLRAACGTEFQVHRLVLCGVSSYFDALYSSDWADTNSALELGQISASDLECCIEWMYTGEAPITSDASLTALFEAAAYLQVESLVEAAAEALRTRLGPATALTTWSAAERQTHAMLAAEAQKIACRHFGAVVAREAEWTAAPVALVHALLADEGLRVAREEEVYHAAIAWVRARSPPLAPSDAVAVLSHVRLPRCSAAFIADTVCMEPLMTTPEGIAMERDAFRGAWYGDARMRARHGADKHVLVIGGAGGDGDGGPRQCLTSVERFDPETNEWKAVASSMATGRKGAAASVVEGKIYVCGGHDGVVRLTSVERFDPATNTWEAVAPMTIKRYSAAAAVVEGKIYVCGGIDGVVGLTSAVERFDPATNTWEAVAPMTIKRYSPAAAVVEGKIYVCGGWDGRDGLTSVERFDPATNTWEAVAPMTIKRYIAAAAVIEGKIYVCGGVDGGDCLTSVERFDPATNTWEAVAPMTIKRHSAAAAALEGKIYVCGGWGGWDRLTSAERFDPATNTWEAVASMATMRAGAAAVAL